MVLQPTTSMLVGIGVVLPFAIAASTALSLRFYTRMILLRARPILEDYLLLAGMTLNLGTCFASLWAYKYGLGEHVEESKPTPEMAAMVHKYLIFLAVIWFFALGTVKTSALLLYKRIFSVMKPFVRLCYAMLVVNFLITTLGALGSTVYLCFPVSYWWQRWYANPPPGHCSNAQAIEVSFAAINFTMDCLVILMPVPLLKRLNLNRARKKALMVVFGLSAVPAVSAAVHIISMIKLNGPDYTYWIFITFLTGSIEVFVGIICNCLPMLTPLALRYCPRLFSADHATPSVAKSGHGTGGLDSGSGSGPGSGAGSNSNTNSNTKSGSGLGSHLGLSRSRSRSGIEVLRVQPTKVWTPRLSGSGVGGGGWSMGFWGKGGSGGAVGDRYGLGSLVGAGQGLRRGSSCSQEPITGLGRESEFVITKTTELRVEMEGDVV